MHAAEIRQYHAGWHDALHGMPCQSDDFAYRLGYSDATH
ncbi:hypothetical protein PTE31013_04660 [Pandoraea terrigena]|uniref:Uncharacterized protein n=1 Tax=Pandoraea terrigena TaxID=2508292 RepID=A0A5E4YN49_9BURK|nr:hypothetical protein PTE31013_04660 [Pandoraea terrigena]